MEQENINLLTLTEYYMLESKITERPYMDVNFNCYLFEIKSEAESFASGLENVSVRDRQYYRTAVLCSELYDCGFAGIKIKKRSQDDFMNIPVSRNDVKKAYYNPMCNRNLNRLQQTRKKIYLKGLKETPFLAPMLMSIRLPAQYPSMYYSYAVLKDNQPYYVLFTTLKEFEQWNMEQECDWKPAELNLRKFERIRGDSPVLINPLSDRLILDDKQIKIIFSKSKREEKK